MTGQVECKRLGKSVQLPTKSKRSFLSCSWRAPESLQICRYRRPLKLQEIAAQLYESPDKQISLSDAHGVTNIGNDRAQLSNTANQAGEEIGVGALRVVADLGYYKGLEIVVCEQAGVTTFVPIAQAT